MIYVVFWSHMSKTSGVKFTPRILIGPWFQSNLYFSHILRFDFLIEPTDIALVFLHLFEVQKKVK